MAKRTDVEVGAAFGRERERERESWRYERGVSPSTKQKAQNGGGDWRVEECCREEEDDD